MIQTFNQIKIDAPRISNYLLFEKPEFVAPKVPQFFIQSQNRWVENFDHPDYVEGLQLHQVRVANFAYEMLLKRIKLVDPTTLNLTAWKNIYRRIRQLEDGEDSEEYLYFKYFLFAEKEQQQKLINCCCLTESHVLSHFNRITVTKFGEDIHTVSLSNTINTGIEYTPIIIGNDVLVNPIDEWNACTKSNMNFGSWINNEYDLSVMALTVALYRLNRLAELHAEDEQVKQQNKKNKG